MNVFYFWESRPGTKMPGYLELCVETWRRNIPNAEIIRIHHGNLAEWSGNEVDVDRLKRFTFMLQSDVAVAAVLAKHSGLFLDTDTIILPGFDPELYPRSKLTVYGNEAFSTRPISLAFFFAPEAGHPLFPAWREEANRRIAEKTQGLIALRWWLRRNLKGKPIKVPWWHLGSEIVDPLFQESHIARQTSVRDSVQYGHRPNDRGIDNDGDVPSTYRHFWFRTDTQPDTIVADAKDSVIALLNSMSPDWYSKMSASEVLKDKHLISRVIRAGLE